jgi:hypothetical protein
MLFVAKFAKYRAVVSPGTMRWVRDQSGSERQIDNGDFFWCEFVTGGLDLHQRELAVQEFMRLGGNTPFGAEPVPIDGTINQMDAASQGETNNAFEGYLVYQRLSHFDTEDGRMCPSRWRDEAEQTLIDSPDYGRDLIRIDLLEITQPWPTYDTFDADKIAAYAKAGGLRIDDVIRYEKATQDRPTVLASLEVAKAQQALEDAEAAALSVPA